MRAQGYTSYAVLNQDNTSAIQQEKNGWKSCGKKSRHMNIRYFLVKDRVARGEIDIIYCPAEEMLGDFHSKPLQGGLFRKFRNRIMNCEQDFSMLAKTAKEVCATPPSPRSVLDIGRETAFRRENPEEVSRVDTGDVRGNSEGISSGRAQSMRDTSISKVSWAEAVRENRRRPGRHVRRIKQTSS